MENKSSAGSRIAKSTLAITIFLLIGKVFGFFRESLTACVFGAGKEMDAFSLAQAATAMIAGFVTQAIATTYIPSAQKAEVDHGPSRKNYFTNNLLMVTSLVSFVLIILGNLRNCGKINPSWNASSFIFFMGWSNGRLFTTWR